MIRWWLDLGIDGFRLDAISHIQKMPWSYKIKSWKGNGPWIPFMNVSGIETYMAELKAIFDEYGALTVGEASGVQSTEAPDWTDESGYINMIFELEHNVRKANDQSQGDTYGYKKSSCVGKKICFHEDGMLCISKIMTNREVLILLAMAQ